MPHEIVDVRERHHLARRVGVDEAKDASPEDHRKLWHQLLDDVRQCKGSQKLLGTGD